MRIGIISDIHSNYRAFGACTEYMEREEVDIYLLLGDFVSDTPCPEKVMDMVYALMKKHRVMAIRGNRERYMLDNRDHNSNWKDGSSTGNLLYTYEHLRSRDLEFFSKLPVSDTLRVDGYPSITFCHGSPASDRELIYMDTDSARRWLTEIDTDYLIAGHTHQKCIYRYNGRTYINTGSCGIPIHNAGMAECVILTGTDREWDIRMVSVPYDVYAVVDEIFDSGLYARGHWFINTNIQTLTCGIDRATQLVEKAHELMNDDKRKAVTTGTAGQQSGSNNGPEDPGPTEEHFRKAAEAVGVPEYGNNRHPIIVRMAVPEDAREILNIYKPYIENTAITFECEVPSVEEFSNRIRNTRKQYPYMVAVRDGEILGYAYASQFRSRAAYSLCAELSLYIRKDVHRQDIGELLLSAMEEALRRQCVVKLYSVVTDCEGTSPYMPKESLSFHKKHGFTVEGVLSKVGVKFGKWFDIVFLYKQLNGTVDDPGARQPYFTKQTE